MVHLGLVLVGRVEHPGVQPVNRSVAERLLPGLAWTGEVAVNRDRGGWQKTLLLMALSVRAVNACDLQSVWTLRLDDEHVLSRQSPTGTARNSVSIDNRDGRSVHLVTPPAMPT